MTDCGPPSSKHVPPPPFHPTCVSEPRLHFSAHKHAATALASGITCFLAQNLHGSNSSTSQPPLGFCLPGFAWCDSSFSCNVYVAVSFAAFLALLLAVSIVNARRLRAERYLRLRDESDRRYQGKLTALQTISNELSQAQSLDELCRRAVSLAGRTWALTE
ncbi:MAG: hypothetical protein HN742_03565 [Lentisphaerae bacterium]|jgi:hypothetical protein|nr:hypothetical protein [Lentisphaerota bacterium]MBT5609686.1 hypothetical protein [Lentisphaerota bacterium]MBT7054810.1 hypothetical protein [Lentisphaerota bacterium]MBT7840919.1 hypothetical protein [Lentisphaerota bacterium]